MSEINVTQEAASARKSTISSHSASFDVTIAPVTGGTAEAITTADELGTKTGWIAGRYATALPRSADDITAIAAQFQETDAQASDQMKGGT